MVEVPFILRHTEVLLFVVNTMAAQYKRKVQMIMVHSILLE